MKRTVPLLAMLGLAALLLAPTSGQQPAKFNPKLLEAFTARNVGPANMTGRIVQITPEENNAKVVYIATASGGVWKTTDGGSTWACVFENEGASSIGDVAVSRSNPNVVWVGTGEHNIRNSVGWGDGVYKSADGGKTWSHMGLKDTHTIGRIAIHHTNPDIVYVGALGHVWGPNKERGVLKTTDGGKTWQPSLFIDEDTGIIDLKMDPTDPDTIYASAYRARRDGFAGSDNPSVFFLGKQAGIYKTSDGGKTWEHLVVATPNSTYGRCGIDIYRKNPNVVYVIAQTDKTPVGEANQGGAVNGKGGPEAGGIYRSDDKGKTWKHMNTNCPRPFYYGQVRVDPNDDQRVYVLGVNTSVSTDGGKTFGGKGKKGEDDPDAGGGGGDGGFIFFGDAQGDQKKDEQKKDDQKKDDQKKGDPGKKDEKKDDQKKKGGGGGGGMHSDHHALWINPQNSNEVWLGTDGGFGISTNKGQGYRAVRVFAASQFYGISVDMRRPYYVYGGLQDNGTWGGPSATYEEGGIRQGNWSSIGIGGDGFHTLNDPTDWNIVYGESQYGGFSKGKAIGGKGGKKGEDDPDAGGGGGGLPEFDAQGDQKKDDQKKDDQKKGDPGKKDEKKDDQKKGGGKAKGGVKGLGVRFNWSSPMHMSPHDPKTLFYGGAFLLMSTERGANWKKISPDLTYGADKKGKIANWRHTLFTIAESPKQKGVIWTGADDGRIMVTKDGGNSWDDVSALPGVPKDRCVSRIEASAHDAGTAYVSISRYRNDDRKSYVCKTTDYGKTWINLSAGLPEGGSTHCVYQSSKNKDLIFAGTEFGLFTSLDDGKTWNQLKGSFPTVAVHQVLIHPRDRELVVGTHGRGIWVYDIAPLEEMTPEVLAKQAHMFWVRPAVAYKPRQAAAVKADTFVGENPPYGAVIHYYLNAAGANTQVTILDKSGKELVNLGGSAQVGVNKVVWNLRASGSTATVAPGEYTARLQVGSQTLMQTVRVEAE